jgi:hypothetical protein
VGEDWDMNIEIHKLAPHLLNDYLHCFETDAHADNPNEDRCYCVGWCSADHSKDMGFSSPDRRREMTIQYINSGMLQGYLAYDGGKAVGWCNANTKSECLKCDGWLRFRTSVNQMESEPNLKVKSIYCFTVVFSAMSGSLELYKRNGFVVYKEVNDKYKGKYDLKYFVVRKYF